MRLLKQMGQRVQFSTVKPPKNQSQFGRLNQSENYLLYRPSYPKNWLLGNIEPLISNLRKTSKTVNAIDLACGSGQLTMKIMPYFDKVMGVDFNENQLKNLGNYGKIEITNGKLELEKFDCTKIDDLLFSPQVKLGNYKFVFIAEAFHWFDYEDFLTRFREAVPEKNVYLVLMGYPILKTLPVVSENLREDIINFGNKIHPFFKFNLISLENEYKEFDFKDYFEHVEFSEHVEEIKDGSLLHFLGYLDTLSAYRNYLEFYKGKNDPLLELMEKWGFKNFEGKDFSKIEYGENSPRTISYKNKYFMYILK